MAATDIVFTGMYHAIGNNVSVVICGLDCGDHMVDVNGDVTVPLASDPDGLLSGYYVAQFDVGPYDTTTYGNATTQISMQVGIATMTMYVPVVIGYSYPSVGQLLRPVTEAQIKSPSGPGEGKTKRIEWVSIFFNNAAGVQVGTDINAMWDVQFPDGRGGVLGRTTLFSGVYADNFSDNYSYDNMIAWYIFRPYPCSVVSVSGFLHSQDR